MDETKPTEDSTEDNQQLRLINVLYSLEEQIKRQTSLKFAFVRGAVYGLGTVIGATILLAIFGGILTATLSSLAELPIVGGLIDKDVAEEISTP